jgi:hypothetical protein
MATRSDAVIGAERLTGTLSQTGRLGSATRRDAPSMTAPSRARGDVVEVRIGVTYTPKELQVDLGDDADRDMLVSDVEKALASDVGVLWLTDRKGRRVGIPATKVAYVEIGSPDEDRRVGFGTR